ncbi:MAG: hypothetical protein CMJ41_10500 [Phycisphaerae bacterium]|nr:hypothetical protein [Phycisphaerae bacterium]
MRHLDSFLERWFGWSRPPVYEEPVLADSVLQWCPRCGAGCDGGHDESGCGACRGRSPVFDGVVRLGDHRGELRTLIGGLKYRGHWEVAGPLGRMLALRLEDGVVPGRLLDPRRTIVVPVPMPLFRRFVRGVDHAALVARAVSCGLGCGYRSLLRQRGGRRQVGLGRNERIRGGTKGRRRFRVRRSQGGSNLNGYTVVLVDDVLTTGRTAREAGRCLAGLRPSRIVLAVLAVAEPGGFRSARSVGVKNRIYPLAAP